MLGKVIGNYQITSELAQGGMGAVYRGRHQKLPREVVVKSILLTSFPPHAQEHLKARFVREAYIQSQLDHPNIVRVYEFFTAPENYYLVMEFVNGMSLRDLLQRQGALAPNQVVGLFKQALAALAYAHNFSYEDESGRPHTGIIHRDIKPANFLLDGKANLKITDFGIVKLAGERSMTRTGFNPGTIEYMSPEQIRGLDVDARSDLYSLGVAFYEALTGRLPFPFSETGSEYEVFKGHMEIPPPPIATVQPSVPPSLAALVMHSLEKDPARRFQSAADFLDALLEYERRSATASQQTEYVAFAPQPQINHLVTERLGLETNQAPLTVEVTPPVPTQPNSVKPKAPAPHIPLASERPVSPQQDRIASPPAQPQSRHTVRPTGLIAAGVILLLLAAAAGIYFFLQSRNAKSTTEAVTSTAATVTVPTPAVAPPKDERLRQARTLEQEEHYVEAIKLYDEYLQANRQAADAEAVSALVAELKKVQGLLAVAELEIGKKDYPAAKRDFSDALKLRPNSKRAQTGLAQAETQSAHPR